jgi:hypothetical protein
MSALKFADLTPGAYLGAGLELDCCYLDPPGLTWSWTGAAQGIETIIAIDAVMFMVWRRSIWTGPSCGQAFHPELVGFNSVMMAIVE